MNLLSINYKSFLLICIILISILISLPFYFKEKNKVFSESYEAKTIISFFLQNLKISEYHLNGVSAVLYKLYKVLYLDHLLSDLI